MRATVEIDDDVFSAIEEIADEQGVTIGKVLSDMARQVLNLQVEETTRNGVPLFPVQPDAGVVTLKLIRQLSQRSWL